MTPFGVYVHVPFCRERCDYCAFATYTDRDHLMERYADACVLELQKAFGAGDLALPTSVFRAKGFIRLAESPGQLHTFQQVRYQSELLLLPLENGSDLTTGLVFIGPHLDEKRIRELADSMLSMRVT